MASGIKSSFPTFLAQDSTTVAKKLLGCHLIREIDGRTIDTIIVETESYDQTDAASHSFNGQTPRTDVMFGPSGHLYVYFTYGMHYCCNVVTGDVGEGAAVLIRAVMPLDNTDYLVAKRGRGQYETTNGPAKLCAALGIDWRLNGHDLRESPLRLTTGSSLDPDSIVQTHRIGISKERHAVRRFYIRDNPYVSRRIIET